MSFYELQGPTQWAASPTTWSTSSLDEVEACPRRWQLLRSRWGTFERFPVRQHPAAIEGQIVHEALERLTRTCGQRGNPPFGSEEFAAALVDADFFAAFARAVADWQQRLAAHPRPGPAFRLRVTSEELVNRAVRMFREQYRPYGRDGSWVVQVVTSTPTPWSALLRRKRALAEVTLTHPQLPFLGVLDRVQITDSGVEVVDFKTGQPSERHRRQLLRYALLWWRETGEAPCRVSAQYLNGAESWPVDETLLERVEAELALELTRVTDAVRGHPAVATPGPSCHACPVRARCNEGWTISEESARTDGRGDAELVALANAEHHGFVARSRTGAPVSVVYEKGLKMLLPAVSEGSVIRIVDGVWNPKCTELELKYWTEVYRVS
jgi:hypothetical protein